MACKKVRNERRRVDYDWFNQGYVYGELWYLHGGSGKQMTAEEVQRELQLTWASIRMGEYLYASNGSRHFEQVNGVWHELNNHPKWLDSESNVRRSGDWTFVPLCR